MNITEIELTIKNLVKGFEDNDERVVKYMNKNFPHLKFLSK